jgi:hypothetical protein
MKGTIESSRTVATENRKAYAYKNATIEVVRVRNLKLGFPVSGSKYNCDKLYPIINNQF